MKFANCTTPDHHRKLLQWQSQLHYECKTLSSLLEMLGSRRLRSWGTEKLRSRGSWETAPGLRRCSPVQVMASVKVVVLAKNLSSPYCPVQVLGKLGLLGSCTVSEGQRGRWRWRQHLHWSPTPTPTPTPTPSTSLRLSPSGQSPAAVSPSNKCHSKFCCTVPSVGLDTELDMGLDCGHSCRVLRPQYSVLSPSSLVLSTRTLLGGYASFGRVDFLWKIKICKQLSSQFEFRKYFKWPGDFRAD